MLNPVFEKFPAEIHLAGIMVLGYTELDTTLCHAAGYIMNQEWAVVDALHAAQAEGTRIEFVNRLTRNAFREKKLEKEFIQCLAAIRVCHKIRNAYAHAKWVDMGHELAFMNPNDVKWEATAPLPLSFTSLNLLKSQVSYFEYALYCLSYLELVSNGRPPNYPFPKESQPPEMHTRTLRDEHPSQRKPKRRRSK